MNYQKSRFERFINPITYTGKSIRVYKTIFCWIHNLFISTKRRSKLKLVTDSAVHMKTWIDTMQNENTQIGENLNMSGKKAGRRENRADARV